ncbi:MAG: efflux RND transporter periplasmic adaptor subunit, partial [Candidatus Methylacidiphilales bacterium]
MTFPRFSVIAAALAVWLTLVQASAANPFGYTEPYREIKMSFPEAGVISEVMVKEGQRVKKGEILARQNYQIFQKDLEIAQQEIKIQSQRLDKMKALGKGRISSDEITKAELELIVSRLKAQRTEAQIDYLTLRSPFDGIISEVKKDVADSVNASNHVLTVVELDKLSVKMFLPPALAYKLETGKAYTLVLPETQQTVNAKVEFISPVNDAASNTVRVKFIIPNTDAAYKSGVRCEPDFGPAITLKDTPSSSAPSPVSPRAIERPEAT